MTRCQDCGDNDDIDNQDGDDDWPGSEVSSRTWRANQLRCRSPVDQTNDDDIQNMMKNLLTASEVEAAMMMISKTMILMTIRMKIIVTMIRFVSLSFSVRFVTLFWNLQVQLYKYSTNMQRSLDVL